MAERPLLGINLAGGEFSNCTYPSLAQVDYYAARGLKLLRIPVTFARTTAPSGSSFVASQVALNALLPVIDRAEQRGMIIVHDLHDFACRPDGSALTTSAADRAWLRRYWRVWAGQLRSRKNVWFGLMNEPHVQSPDEWVALANEATLGIREVAQNTICVMGSRWGVANGWVSSGNAKAMLAYRDPADNYLFEMHQYLDNHGGKPEQGFRAVTGVGASALEPATKWLRANGKRGFLGEFGFTADPGDVVEGTALLDHLAANADVWTAAAYWAGGLPWAEGRSSYAFSVEPRDFVGAPDRPQMNVLRRFT